MSEPSALTADSSLLVYHHVGQVAGCMGHYYVHFTACCSWLQCITIRTYGGHLCLDGVAILNCFLNLALLLQGSLSGGGGEGAV